MPIPNQYDIGDEIVLSATFTDLNGNPVDPTDVIVYIGNPTLAPTVQTFKFSQGQVTKNGVGLYSFTFIPTVHSWWEYKWQGTGAVVAACPDTTFYVRSSFAIAG